jgi:hypothetical protein
MNLFRLSGCYVGVIVLCRAKGLQEGSWLSGMTLRQMLKVTQRFGKNFICRLQSEYLWMYRYNRLI